VAINGKKEEACFNLPRPPQAGVANKNIPSIVSNAENKRV
jgi:hypothetical protein